MKVRIADPIEDALQIVDGARDFARRAPIRALAPNDDNLIETVSRVATLDGLEIVACEHDGKIVGGLGVIHAPYIWNPRLLAAEELFWWVSGNAPQGTALALIRGAWKRAQEREAKVRIFRALTGNEGFDAIYRRLGMVPVETSYVGLFT